MAQSRRNAWAGMGLMFNLLSLPYHFLLGLVIGLVAPVAAIAAVVTGVRLLTGRMPFLSQNRDAEGEPYLTLNLVPPEEVGGRLAEQKQAIGDDLGRIRAEIRAILEEAQSAEEEA
ncbi:MAG TPA: hypothetical protein ENJ31_03000 [Anaerolineae bacterium]|nr:hypothetical protein [Anaerolineae bacterium]